MAIPSYTNDNSNNNPCNNNVNPPKRRWYHSKRKKRGGGGGGGGGANNKSDLPPSQSNEEEEMITKQNLDKIRNQRIQDKLDNDAQVARMEEQLHNYFQKSNTPYTYINDTGIYNYNGKQNETTKNNIQVNNIPVNNPDPFTIQGQTNKLFSLFPINPFITAFPFNPLHTGSDNSTKNKPESNNEPKKDKPINENTDDKDDIEEIMIHQEIKDINDLIDLCDKYPLSDKKKYNINMKAIHLIKQPLTDLSKMIGMDNLKQTIVDQILYYVQNLHIRPKSKDKQIDKGDSSITVDKTNNNTLKDESETQIPAADVLNPFASEFIPKNNNENNNNNDSTYIESVSASATASASAASSNSIKPDIDISSRIDFGNKVVNPFANMQPVFNFNALNPNKKELVNDQDGDFMHTVIYGPPGTGKTEVAKIIGRIFSSLGILSKNTFKKVSRHDLVAGYLGQTAIKTKDIIKASLGGVLFIDEAYSLGNSEKRDSFAKECIDTLCEALSEYKNDWMVIIAGYEKELNDCFFNFNDGLNSRFTWRFRLDGYKSREMKEIFIKKVNDYNWCIAEGNIIPDSWFETKMEYFTTYGRDMETLFTKTKIAHSRRVFCLPASDKTRITNKDLDNGFKLFLENPEVKDRKDRGSMGNYMKALYV